MEKRKRIRRKRAASTQDIVGQTSTNSRINPRWRGHYQALVTLRDHLNENKGDLAKDALEERPRFSSHMAEAATDAFDRDLALSLLSSEQDALYEIEQALDRIRNGSFGVCELTGKPIEPARLAAVPWTRFCAEAERELEKKGTFKNPRLNPVREVTRENVPTSKSLS